MPPHLSSAERARRRKSRGLTAFTEAEYARRRAVDGRRIAAHQAYIDALKLAAGCVDCGYRDAPEALDFDHLPGAEKARNLSKMHFYSRAKVDEEIAKCEVVCANCHRIRTALRKRAVV